MNPQSYTFPNGEVITNSGAAVREMAQDAKNAASEVVGQRSLSVGAPSKSLLGLPLARLIPQDIHSVMDYVNGVATGIGLVMDTDSKARLASAILAGSVIGVSAMTDYRLSLAKVIPIEVHEATDHVWGLTAIALPFLLGYWKKSPVVAMTHVISGAGTILASLLTDYRSYKRRNGR